MTKEQKIVLLSEFSKNKNLIEKAEKRIQELRNQILTDFKSGEYGDFVVLISETERESFNLKDAKEKVPEKYLTPFIKKTSFKTVKVQKS